MATRKPKFSEEFKGKIEEKYFNIPMLKKLLDDALKKIDEIAQGVASENKFFGPKDAKMLLKLNIEAAEMQGLKGVPLEEFYRSRLAAYGYQKPPKE